MNEEYVVLDIETTGLSKYMHQITEIAAVKIRNGKTINQFQTLVNPGIHIPSFITRLTGIDDKMVKDAPSIKEVLPDFLKFLGENIMVAHNATFDYGFLNHNAERHLNIRLKNEKVCTRRLANRLLPDLPSKKLGTLCEYMQVKNKQAHRALSDAKATAELFNKMITLLKLAEVNTKSDIIHFQNSRIKKGELQNVKMELR